MLRCVTSVVACAFIALNTACVHAQKLAATPPVITLKGHEGAIRSIVYSSDGKRLATAGTSPNRAAEIRIWDTSTGKLLQSFDEPKTDPSAVVFSPDGKLLACSIGNEGKHTYVWNLETGKRHSLLTAMARVQFSPDSKRIVGSIPGRNTVVVLDVATNKELLAIKAPRSIRVRAVAFSPNGKQIAHNNEGDATIFDAETGKEIHNLETESGNEVWQILYTPDGKKLIVEGGRLAKVWDLSNGKLLHKLSVKDADSIEGITLTPDGKRIVGWANPLRVFHVWELESGADVLTSRHPENDARRKSVFSPDLKQMAILFPFQVVKLMNVPSFDK